MVDRHRPHAINSTDEYLAMVLDELEGIRGLLTERLPAPGTESGLTAGATARVVLMPTLPDPDAVPVDIKEPAEPPPAAAPPRKRAVKKATPAKTIPEE